MARSNKGAAGAIAGGFLIALTLGATVRAQEQATEPPYSQECQSGGAAIVEQSPLPNVTAALATRKTLKILTIGASPAAGRRQTKGGYTALIEDLLQHAIKGLDVVMINRGVSGELAANAATRIRNEIALTHPDLVLWQVGTNDALAYIALPYIRATVIETVHWLREHKVDVILVGLQYVDRLARNANYLAVREALSQIAMHENVMIVRRDDAMKLINRTKSDGGVPLPDEFEQTETGYTCLAQYVARSITVGVFGKSLRKPAREGGP